MKYSKAINNLNVRKNSKGDLYTAYSGRETLAKNLKFYGGVWKIALNNGSVDYYENAEGQVIYILKEGHEYTYEGLYFESAELELSFLFQFMVFLNSAQKMNRLITIIKEG